MISILTQTKSQSSGFQGSYIKSVFGAKSNFVIKLKKCKFNTTLDIRLLLNCINAEKCINLMLVYA